MGGMLSAFRPVAARAILRAVTWADATRPTGDGNPVTAQWLDWRAERAESRRIEWTRRIATFRQKRADRRAERWFNRRLSGGGRLARWMVAFDERRPF